MKKALALLAIVLLSACVRPGSVSDTSVSLAPQLAEQTIALVRTDKDGDVMVYCSGVWVSDRAILTAAHCVEDQHEVEFIVHEDQPELFELPNHRYTAYVARRDSQHDLALIISSESMASHPYARLASAAPKIGAGLAIIGHPMGLSWTYLTGSVSAYRQRMPAFYTDSAGPFMQIFSGVTNGNSGCGAFDSSGRLVGIVILKAPHPSHSFAVHLDTIRAFLQ